MLTGRRYQLRPWLVRCLIPNNVIGTYVLWSADAPFYAGRSDTSLQRRLLEHAHNYQRTYFTFDVTTTMEQAFDMECSLFHALSGQLTNLIHPGRPGFSAPSCAFCNTTIVQMQSMRLPQALNQSA